MGHLYKHIPNILTLGNAVCGSWMIYFALHGLYATTLILGCLALLFDFLDGFMARLLNSSSSLGIILDSLADCISFALGSMILFVVLIVHTDSLAALKYITASLLIIAGVLRLAIFTNQQDQKEAFKGIPTPATFLFYLGLMWYHIRIGITTLPPFTLEISAVVFSYLMISRHNMLNFKNLRFKIAGNVRRISLIFIAILLFIFYPFLALPSLVVAYICISLIPEKE